MRYKIHLSYDGSGFHGWQTQSHDKTIQECLEDALSTLLRERISVTGAGRTDSTVNAVGYVAHFDTSAEDLDAGLVGYKINAILPHGIKVHDITQAPPDFHSRFDARQREYKYFIHRKKDPFISHYSYLYTFPLDVEKMNRAAVKLLGKHDFSCFMAQGSPVATTVRNVISLKTERTSDKTVTITVSADGFLYNMVRIIAGTLIYVSEGKIAPADIPSIIESRDRTKSGMTLPPDGLYLNRVVYK